MTNRFQDLKYLPFGDVVLLLDDQIRRCNASADLAGDEELETYYREAEVVYREFKAKIVRMFKEMQV